MFYIITNWLLQRNNILNPTYQVETSIQKDTCLGKMSLIYKQEGLKGPKSLTWDNKILLGQIFWPSFMKIENKCGL